jgi:two-component system sensor histidine kinase RegB
MSRRPLRFAVPQSSDEGTLWLSWLVRLRWVAILAQIITLAFVFPLLASLQLMGAWLAVIVALVGANAWAHRVLEDERDHIEAITVFGRIMLPPRHAAALAAFSVLCYSALFLGAFPLDYAAHPLPMRVLYPLGHALAQIISSTSVAVFVIGVASSLRRRREQLLQARERTERTDRLRSVGTLAAGAAHELNTPLSTIGLRLRRLGRRHTDDDSVADLTVIKEQLDRCTGIVERLLVGAGDPTASDIEVRPMAAMVCEAVGLWEKGATIGVEVVDDSGGLEVELPRVAFQQALINLLENARQAQEEVDVFSDLQVRVERTERGAEVVVLDRGVGLPDDASQVGDPFFTTKPTGTGLGVFVATSVADGAGGGLVYERREGGGTAARWWFPPARRRA